jgi:hypothetical protein
MSFSLKPHPLIAHWVPGVAFLVLAWGSYHEWTYLSLPSVTSEAALLTLVASVMAFVIGAVFDAFRNSVIENRLDKTAGRKIEWNRLITADKEQLDRLENYYFTYYVLDWNLALCIFALLVIWLVVPPQKIEWGYLRVVLIVVALLLSYDAMSLRGEIKEVFDKWR